MAGDTRDSNQSTPRGPPPGAVEPPDHVKTPNKVYEVFNSPPPSANALPEGSGQNTAGGRERPPAITDAVKTIKLEDFKKVHMYPCVRESLLMGIGSGFGIGGIRALWGGMFSSARVKELLLINVVLQLQYRKLPIGPWGRLSLLRLPITNSVYIGGDWRKRI